VRHLGKVGNQVTPLDILTDANGQWVGAAGGILAAQDITQGDSLAIGVWNLDANSTLAWNWGENPDFV
jgi:hypothetical protein